jgi:short-subunit dehydrogenase
VLVNNAGFAWFGPTKDLDVATFDRLFAANVRAAYFLVAALAPDMDVRGNGSIINIASMGATTVEIPSSHVAMVSHPGKVAQLIETGAAAVPPPGGTLR